MADKIVIVSGQEFTVPAETDNEVIRSQLAAQGFPDVASAEIKKGKKKLGEVEYETIEFVKRVGTKGIDPSDLAALFSTVLAVPAPARKVHGPDPQQYQLLTRLMAGEFSMRELLDQLEPMGTALQSCFAPDYPQSSREGADLCKQLDQVPAIAAPVLPLGW